jgi:molybdopterin/thiamine biosynthesis adenylyltransferase
MSYTPYILIGAGGTGSHFIAPVLAYLHSWHNNQGGEWDLILIDGDNYEHKNLERQMFDPQFVGLNKAEALASMYSRYPVQAIPKFVGAEDLKLIMDEGCVVFLGVDNFSVRALVEQRAYELEDVTIINAGNEKDSGSVQLWVRENGENKTPPISYLHPEIAYSSSDDRSNMTCMEVAQMPGGEQLIIANMAAAQHMMTALWRYHNGSWKDGWTELQFDLSAGEVQHIDMRLMRNWERDRVAEIPTGALLPNLA